MFPDAVFVSALTGDGIDAAMQQIDTHLSASDFVLDVTIAPPDGAARAWLYANGTVQTSAMNDDGEEQLSVILGQADWARFQARWPKLVTAR